MAVRSHNGLMMLQNTNTNHLEQLSPIYVLTKVSSFQDRGACKGFFLRDWDFFTAQMSDFNRDLFIYNLSNCYIHTRAWEFNSVPRRKSF